METKRKIKPYNGYSSTRKDEEEAESKSIKGLEELAGVVRPTKGKEYLRKHLTGRRERLPKQEVNQPAQRMRRRKPVATQVELMVLLLWRGP